MSYKVIDLSKFNQVVDFKAVSDNVDGIILRAGYRAYVSGKLTVDPKFKEYMDKFYKNKTKMGIYYFTTAINAVEGREEAEFAVSLIKNYKLSFPIFVDTEIADVKNKNGRSDKISKAARTEAIIGFCERIKELGYTPGIYASDSWFITQLDFDRIKKYKLWVASYSYAPKRVTNYIAWQYSSNGSVPGILGRVDMNKFEEISAKVEAQKESTVVDKPKDTEEQPISTKKYTTLRIGSRGSLVKEMQSALHRLGYILDIDGEYGPQTLETVRKFQKANNLVVDGIAGPKTLDKLYSMTSTKKELKVGAPVELKGVGLYSNSKSSIRVRSVTATWYIANINVVNDKIRVKQTPSTEVVAGWIRWNDISDQFR